jgi:hypothetical protein
MNVIMGWFGYISPLWYIYLAGGIFSTFPSSDTTCHLACQYKGEGETVVCVPYLKVWFVPSF